MTAVIVALHHAMSQDVMQRFRRGNLQCTMYISGGERDNQGFFLIFGYNTWKVFSGQLNCDREICSLPAFLRMYINDVPRFAVCLPFLRNVHFALSCSSSFYCFFTSSSLDLHRLSHAKQ